MAKKDQDMRKSAYKTGEWDTSVDRKNTERMKRIIKKYGWLTIQLVGRKGSQNVWLLIQHADYDIAFQKKCLKLIKDSYKNNHKSINPANIAYLTDHILVNENKKQIFGTQFYRNRNGRFVPRPIRAIKSLEERRVKYGLTTFREYQKEFKNFKPQL